MIWNWDNAFEGSPSGSDYGSVSGLALRKTKEAFLALLEAEHTVDLDVDATVSHTLGQASVLGPATYSEITMESGCLVLDGGALYSYDGADTLGFGDHTLLENVTASDHPQYLAKSSTEIKGPIACTKISGLTEVLQGYTDTHFLLSNAGHPEDGTPSHGVVSVTDLGIGSDLLSPAESSVTRSFDLTSGGVVSLMYIGAPSENDTDVAAMPTAGSYTIALEIVSVNAIVVEADTSLSYRLAAPLGGGGASYQTNLLIAAVATEAPEESHNSEQITLNAIGLS